MSKQRIYLAGPIKGLTFDESTDWRKKFAYLVEDYICLSPMRGKQVLASEEVIGDDYPREVLSCQRGIMTRDFFDCTRANLVVANFLGAEKVSVGTVMEIAWAWQARIPVVVMMEATGNPHDHSMVREAIGFRVESLEAAAEVVKQVLWK